MRISDLSARTGVPVATIKFYLREGLLPPGTPTRRNQADYDEQHVRALRFVRTLTSIGQFELSAVREILTAVAAEDLPLAELYKVVSRASVPADLPPADLPPANLTPANLTPADTAGLAGAAADVDRFVRELGWRVDADAAARAQLSHVVAGLQQLGCLESMDLLRPYAEAAERLAVRELDLVPKGDPDIERATAVAWTILLEIGLSALLRMARGHHAAIRAVDAC